MKMIAAIAFGGAVGSVLRYAIAGWVTRFGGGEFPLGTLFVNVAGSFVMGLFAALFATRWQLGAEARALLTTGLLGGFTTFSAFSLDAALLFERGEGLQAAVYVAASVALSIMGLFAGLSLIRTFAA